MNKHQKRHLPRRIWHVSGKTNNESSVVLLGGTHGDESTAIAVIDTLLKQLSLLDKQPGTYINKYIHDNVYIGYGNPVAIEKRSRGTTDGRDLNRSFIEKELQQPPSLDDRPDLVRARELAPLLEAADLVVDLHSTSNPSKPFVISQIITKKHFDYLQYLPVDTVVFDPQKTIATELKEKEIGSLSDYVNLHGGIGFAYEVGYEKDDSVVDEIARNIWHFLFKIGTVELDLLKSLGYTEIEPFPIYKTTTYELFHCALAQEDLFTYVSGMEYGWQEIKKGTVIGYYENGKEEVSSSDGMYLFPTGVQKIKTGKNLYYLAHPTQIK